LPNKPVEVLWEKAENECFSNIIKSGVSLALPELAHSAHADVS
jgi:alkaline phosphatase D